MHGSVCLGNGAGEGKTLIVSADVGLDSCWQKGVNFTERGGQIRANIVEGEQESALI